MEQNPHLVEQAAKLNEETRGEYAGDGASSPSGVPPSGGAPPPSGPSPATGVPPPNAGAAPVKTQSTAAPPKSQAKSLSSARFSSTHNCFVSFKF